MQLPLNFGHQRFGSILTIDCPYIVGKSLDICLWPPHLLMHLKPENSSLYSNSAPLYYFLTDLLDHFPTDLTTGSFSHVRPIIYKGANYFIRL